MLNLDLFKLSAFLFFVCLGSVDSARAQDLFTPAASFSDGDHIVSTSFFIWYASNGGQLSGPWLPLEGRPNWTGLTPWWKTQIKQVMMANIDQINVHLFKDPGTEIRREFLFQALSELRAEGYDVPKVAPFFDALVSYPGQVFNLSTASGKETITDEYIKFYTQYFTYNTDIYASDYLAKIDDKLILDTWHIHLNYSNISSFTRSDLQSPLSATFGGSHPVFNNDIYMITTAYSPTVFSFADERTPQFEVNDYYKEHVFAGRKTVQMKAGYWDQNVRNPGSFVPRSGGSNYTTAWNSLAADVDRVYVESWNEYDEGTGIYAGDAGAPYIKPGSGNTNTDTWSSTNDPYEYILTTATNAAAFNESPELGSKVLLENFPAEMGINSSTIVTVTIRNTGDESWTGANDFKFQQVSTDGTSWNATPVVVDDSTNEIPIYKGIFRGRPITFHVTIKAPPTIGTYTSHWQMYKGSQSFGEIITATISTGCSGNIYIEDATIGLSTQFNATNTISLDNVIIQAPADFVLVSPVTDLSNMITVNQGAGLEVISEDGCN